MATTFHVWVNDANLTNNTYDQSTYSGTTRRTTGVQPDEAASAKLINSALRQSSLITCALMAALGIDGTNGLRDSVSDISLAIQNNLPFSTSTGVIKANKVETSSILDRNVTVGKLENTLNTALTNYDATKGSIESRLEALGFKQATITINNNNFVTSIEGYQQGKIVALHLNLKAPSYSFSTAEVLVATITNVEVPTSDLFVGKVWSRTTGGQSGANYYARFIWKTDGNLYVKQVSSSTSSEDISGKRSDIFNTVINLNTDHSSAYGGN